MAGGNVGAPLVRPPFSGSRQKTALSARDRYALSLVRDEYNEEVPCQEVLRHVIQTGLAALGYSEERRIKEYAEYEIQCAKTNTVNEFESR